MQNMGGPSHLEMISSSAPMSHVTTTMAAGPGMTDKQSLKSGQRQSMQIMNQKGAAPITDIRAKRQAATLNVDDLPANGPGVNISTHLGGQSQMAGGPSAHQLANQHIAQIHRNNKKFVEMASKANSNMLAAQQAHQQMLLNQFSKATPNPSNERRIDTFDNVGPVTSTSAQGPANNRASSQQMSHTGSRSSKNAIVVPNLNSSNPNPGKHNSSSSKRKASKKLG